MEERIAKLGIDLWSIVLYMANTGVVLAVLFYYLYKPLLKVIDDRRKQIKDSVDEANNLREEFTKQMEDSRKEKKKIEAEFNKEIANLQKMIDQKHKAMVAEMEENRATMMRKAQEEIDARKKALIKDVEQEVASVMTRIILNIVQNKVPENVIQDSIQESWKEYNH